MTEQLAFNIYSYAVVGFLGNALIGWELGQKGWIGLGLEGPRNKKVTFALFCFMVMVLWQTVGKLDSPFTSWKDLWILAWGILVFTVSHFLVPRSMRLYRQAKLLHETTYAGDWLKSEFGEPIEEFQPNERLLQAEGLYLEALGIQKRLSEQAETDALLIQHQQNVVITCLQLALLYLQQRCIKKAADMSTEAIKIAEALSVRFPNNTDILSIMSNAFFRDAEVEQVQGRFDEARANYERSLEIDRRLQKETDINITESRLKELKDLKFRLPNQE